MKKRVRKERQLRFAQNPNEFNVVEIDDGRNLHEFVWLLKIKVKTKLYEMKNNFFSLTYIKPKLT